jgi:ribosomal-protein-alanine N-acetyltransferase
METLQFEVLQEKHLDEVMPIEQEAYPEPWTIGMFRQDIHNPSAHFYVACIGDTLVGYVGMWRAVDEAHITSVTVRQDYRGRRLGCALVEFILNVARRIGLRYATLEVRESNLRAQRLYYKMGFNNVGRRKGYYHKTNEDAIVMSREIGPADGGKAAEREMAKEMV